jgi:CAAX protease family protein
VAPNTELDAMNAKLGVEGGWERAVLAFALVYPALLTLVYFVWLVGAPETVQQIAYGVGKGIQFGLPLVWIGWIRHEPLRWPRPSASGLMLGISFALIVLAGMMALYFGWLRSAGVFDAGAKSMQLRLDAIGIHNPAVYACVGLFYSLIHSLLEEYYWRWFVFGQLARGCRLPIAIVVSSVAFAAHHVLVLGLYFGYSGPTWGLTWLFALGVAIGGAFWAWLYRASDSLAASWLSHACIDAAIFVIGYKMIMN